MANLGAVGASFGVYDGITGEPVSSSTLSGVAFTGANRLVTGTSFDVYDGVVGSMPPANRLAGAGGSKGTDSGGGGGVPRSTRVYGGSS